MDKPAEICETYQLKWSSYNSYINSCISTSLQNLDSFADVALVTVDGHQIMAHRFILAFSSQFFAHILKLQPKVTSALPTMIVMPPEIDYKTLKVLLRYMYSGEAKVTKEILNSVLKGGDILQVKGLFREQSEKTDKNVKITNSQSQSTPSTSKQNNSTKNLQSTSTPVAVPSTSGIAKPSTSSPSSNSQPSTSQQGQSSSTKTYADKELKEKKETVQPRPKVLNFTMMQNYDKKDPSAGKHSKKKSKTEKVEEKVVIKSEPGTSKETDEVSDFLAIKDEPIEWSEAEMEMMDSKEVFDEMTIKSESLENYDTDTNDEEMFSPLTCELCTETFTIPADWVRHVQTHTDMLPAKRRRRDSPGESFENDTFPELMCDMCQKSFTTPAEWVQHIQNTHTEFELHLSNKNQSPPPLAMLNSRNAGNAGEKRKCTICNKTCPSHASMVIHKRRHTGEKPYSCEYCSKSFNVKSNLLRHLRTLHNKIMNSTEVMNKDFSDNSN